MYLLITFQRKLKCQNCGIFFFNNVKFKSTLQHYYITTFINFHTEVLCRLEQQVANNVCTVRGMNLPKSPLFTQAHSLMHRALNEAPTSACFLLFIRVTLHVTSSPKTFLTYHNQKIYECWLDYWDNCQNPHLHKDNIIHSREKIKLVASSYNQQHSIFVGGLTSMKNEHTWEASWNWPKGSRSHSHVENYSRDLMFIREDCISGSRRREDVRNIKFAGSFTKDSSSPFVRVLDPRRWSRICLHVSPQSLQSSFAIRAS